MQVILNSWKEIATYIGRGIRTAQRWERDLALPVRRPSGQKRKAVSALPSEIDAWLRSCPTHESLDKKSPGTEPNVLLGSQGITQTTRLLNS